MLPEHSGLVSEEKHCEWFGKFSDQTPLGAWSGLGTQLRYKAPCDLQVEHKQSVVINIG